MRLQVLRPRVATLSLQAAALPPKVADPFYSSAAWIALRDRVRCEARGRCQVQGCTRRGAIVDHIVELKDGGAPLERTNVWLLCASHHSLKTVSERSRRTARRPGGLDPWGLWGGQPRGGSRREFFRRPKTTG